MVDVYRVGEDQALEVEPGGAAIEPGVPVEAEVDRETRHATMRNHTATHLLHAALRERLGTHVRQAGSAVRPDKLRFDFTHGQALSPEELRDVEDRVNEWIKASRPVRWLNMDRAEAEKLGAMALFGEKYGEWVRVVEVDGVSRELCGGTHVANTAEVGIFKIASEGSSAANVRRVEAITGPAAIDFFREREAQLREAGELLGNPQDPLAAARRAAEQLKQASAGAEKAQREQLGGAADELAGRAEESAGGGGRAVIAAVDESLQANPKQLLDLANRVQSKLGRPSARRPRRRLRRQGGAGRAGLQGRGRARPLRRLDHPRDRPDRRRRRRRSRRHGPGRRQGPVEARRGAGGGRRGDRAGARLRGDAGARPRPRHRPHRLRALGPERDPGDAAAGDRTAGGARGRRAGRRARRRAGRRRAAAAPQRRGG